MFHKFVDLFMVIINQILHTYAYIQILLKKAFSLSHVGHSNRQLLRFKKVCLVYAHALGLTLSIFHQHYLTGTFGMYVSLVTFSLT